MTYSKKWTKDGIEYMNAYLDSSIKEFRRFGNDKSYYIQIGKVKYQISIEDEIERRKIACIKNCKPNNLLPIHIYFSQEAAEYENNLQKEIEALFLHNTAKVIEGGCYYKKKKIMQHSIEWFKNNYPSFEDKDQFKNWYVENFKRGDEKFEYRDQYFSAYVALNDLWGS